METGCMFQISSRTGDEAGEGAAVTFGEDMPNALLAAKLLFLGFCWHKGYLEKPVLVASLDKGNRCVGTCVVRVWQLNISERLRYKGA